jgi:hypothetical protein
LGHNESDEDAEGDGEDGAALQIVWILLMSQGYGTGSHIFTREQEKSTQKS